MKPTKQTPPKRKPVSKPNPHTSPPTGPPSPNSMPPTPSLVRELTRLRFTRQEKDQQLSALRSSVVQQRQAHGFRRPNVRRRVDDIEGNDYDDVFACEPAEARTRAAALLAATEDRYQVAAVELAVVEMEVELVLWREWLGDGAHEREGCEYCLKTVGEGEGGGEEGLLSRKAKESSGRREERVVGPLCWEKRGGAGAGTMAESEELEE